MLLELYFVCENSKNAQEKARKTNNIKIKK
jgi:hypothetical protein